MTDDRDARCEEFKRRYPPPYETTSVVVEVRDGRRFDITDLSPFEAVRRLRAAGVREGDIRRTVHRFRSKR